MRQLLLLALRVAALLLLALAFARPFLASDAASAASGVTMVALDTSLSLSAPGQFARAQQLAKDAISRAPSGHLVGVLTFADGVQIVAAPSGDRALAAAAVDAARPGLGSTRYRARAVSGGRGARRARRHDRRRDRPAGERLGCRRPGVDSARGARRDRRRRGAAAESRRHWRAPVRRTDRGDDSQHRASAAGRPRPTGDRWRCRPAKPWPRSAPTSSADVALPAARGTSARISIDDADGIQADNVRYLVLDGATRPAVLVVTATGDLGRDAFYVQQALAASGEQGTVFQVVGVAGGAAVVVGCAAAERPRRGGVAVDPRHRSARPRAAGRIRETGRRDAAGRRTGHRSGRGCRRPWAAPSR